MSVPASCDNIDVGSIVTNHILGNEKNHYCCEWKIEKISSYRSKVVKSPVFSLPSRDEFKWHLRIQSFIEINQRYHFTVGLFLDRESKSEETYAKVNLAVLNKNKMHVCNLDVSQFLKFVKNSENCVSISCNIDPSSHLGMISDYFFLEIVCEIMIESSFLENNNLSKDFGALLNNQLLSDVVLSVGGKNYPAHKAILAARSSVFAAMFTHDMVENQGVVRIEDMEGEVVEEMLRYIYAGKVEKLDDLTKALLIAADKYDLKGLRMKCEEIMIPSLSSSNAFDLLLLADSYNANQLKSEAINFIMLTSEQLKKTSAWENICQYPQLLREIFEAVLRPKFTAFELKVTK